MKRDELLELLQKKFPKQSFQEGELFSEEKRGSIHSSGEEYEQLYYGYPLFDYYTESTFFTFGINKQLYELLEKNGWFAEWYDAGTIFIYEI